MEDGVIILTGLHDSFSDCYTQSPCSLARNPDGEHPGAGRAVATATVAVCILVWSHHFAESFVVDLVDIFFQVLQCY